jgi:hypothetical protein
VVRLRSYHVAGKSELFPSLCIDVETNRTENRIAGVNDYPVGSRYVNKRKTYSLIGSDKVEGTAVYRSNGEKVGRIERVMIDKINGKVAYAVMSFGGFMGIGEDYIHYRGHC